MFDESADLHGFFPEIIEVGALLVKEQEIIDTYTSYVKPVAFPVLTKRCRKFLKLKNEDIEQGVSFFEMHAYLKKMNETYKPTIVTWGNRDMSVLRQNSQYHGLHHPFDGDELDLAMFYKQFFGDQNQTGLYRAIEQYGNHGIGIQHMALDDAKTTYKIFQLIERDRKYLNNNMPTTIGDILTLKGTFHPKK